jgi:hypothetical protein
MIPAHEVLPERKDEPNYAHEGCKAEATQEKLTSEDRKAYLATCLKKSA